MKIIRTDLTKPEALSDFEREQVYNGLDVCVTAEVLAACRPQLDNTTAATYAFSRALQGPVLDMRLRGVLVDQVRKNEVIDEYFESLDLLETNLTRIVLDGIGLAAFNWRSSADLKTLFYSELEIPPIRSKGHITVDRAARDKLYAYPIARPLILHLNAMADLAKKISVLKTGIDPDGRIRTSYNITGTNTGRFSSSMSEFGTGGNLQNIEESLRSILIADPGMKFAKFDAKSGESFFVGAIEWNLFQDDTYLRACETGDPHTAAARLCWPDLGWSDNMKADKALAETPFYRHHSYRQTTKKLGHASNYDGQPLTISTQTGMPVNLVRMFQPLYFAAFPAHRRWHEWVRNELWTRGHLISTAGRKRWFMGRRDSDETLRGAIAFDPQSSLAETVNEAMLRCWVANDALLMMHDHDALTFMYPESREDTIIPKLLALLPARRELAHGRSMTIPYDCKVGWNKGDFDPKNPEKNPDGLKDYDGHDTRKRTPQLGFLDRPLRR